MSWPGRVRGRGAAPVSPPSTATEALEVLTRAQLLDAIEALDAGAETASAEFRDYDVAHAGRRYPR